MNKITLQDMLEKISLPMTEITKVSWYKPGEFLILCSHAKGLPPHGDTIEKDFRENVVEARSFEQLQRYIKLLKEERFRFNNISVLTTMDNEESEALVGAHVLANWKWIGRWITDTEFREISWEEYKEMNKEWELQWIPDRG